ncbi:MAG: YqgE/AlgH family protein, partial [Actinobacteria bacterium]|nr:YqgE/AlgH family protein [Actinomycetota bacterium]
MDSLRGKLLIATPSLVDPNFSRTVVLVAAHDEDGALGLVLNRPSDLLVADTVEHLAGVCG